MTARKPEGQKIRFKPGYRPEKGRKWMGGGVEWSAEDVETLRRMQRHGYRVPAIAAALKRTPGAVQQKIVVLRDAERAERSSADALPETHPLVRALAVLQGAGWSVTQQTVASHAAGSAALWAIRPPQALADLRGLVEAANTVLAARGQQPIPYPRLPAAAAAGSARAGETARLPDRRDDAPGGTLPAAVGASPPPVLIDGAA